MNSTLTGEVPHSNTDMLVAALQKIAAETFEGKGAVLTAKPC